MKRIVYPIIVLVLAALACTVPGAAVPTPTFDFNTVGTIAAATMTARIPTMEPPTLAPIASPTPLPTEVINPTVTEYVSSSNNSYPVRILFAEGSASTRIETIVQYPQYRQYLLYAFAGQEMTVTIESESGLANFAIVGKFDGMALKRLENEDRTWTGLLPDTQDYLIQVAVPSGYTKYTLLISIRFVQ